MSSINLGTTEKKDSQLLIENLQGLSQKEIDDFILKFANSGEPAWHRFIKGAYNHPVTWWIGIFQLQMQLGLWGYSRKAAANLRANALWQVTRVLRDQENTDSTEILSKIVRYNLEYKKADISGRIAGGAFTNYASMGGRFGKNVNKNIKRSASLTNFVIASYGAAIKAMASGEGNLESVIQSILTGRPETLPIGLINTLKPSQNKEEMQLLKSSEIALSEVMLLSQLSPPPVPLKEFCGRAENINLSGVCK